MVNTLPNLTRVFGTVAIPNVPVTFGTNSIPVPDTAISLGIIFNTGIRHFGKFGITSIPVADTSVSAV